MLLLFLLMIAALLMVMILTYNNNDPKAKKARKIAEGTAEIAGQAACFTGGFFYAVIKGLLKDK